MRRFIFDRQGEICLYLTGAGVIYDPANHPLATVQDEQVLSLEGRHLGWFDGQFLWSPDGYLLGFVKGATPQGGLRLPATKPLRFRPEPRPVAFKPLLVPRSKPVCQWVWSTQPFQALANHWA
jgi:hypothetical protein